MLKQAKILNTDAISKMLPDEVQCKVVNEKFFLGETYLPNWTVYQLLPEGSPIQLINDKFVMSPSPSFNHQSVAGNLYKKISDYAEKNNLGIVVIAPLDVHLADEEIYQPDIFFIASENKNIIHKSAVYGAPDFIIEILSPSNSKYDLTEKKNIYEAKGVKEYWVVDPETNDTTGYILLNGKFELLEKTTGKISSKIFNTTFLFG